LDEKILFSRDNLVNILYGDYYSNNPEIASENPRHFVNRTWNNG